MIDVSRNIKIKWDYIYEWGLIGNEEQGLMSVPLVGYVRAKPLVDMGIKDIEQLAKAMTILLNNQELQRKLAENALNQAKQCDWNKVAEAFEKVLHEAL